MKNVSKIVENAIKTDSSLTFTYSNVNKNKVSKRYVQPVEIISDDVLVAIDLEANDYRRFSYDNMTEVETV